MTKQWRPTDVFDPLDFSKNGPADPLQKPEGSGEQDNGQQEPGEDERDHHETRKHEEYILEKFFRLEWKADINCGNIYVTSRLHAAYSRT